MMWYGGGDWDWLMMAVGMTAFWAVVIVAMYAVARSTGWTRRDVNPTHASAEQILAERFARAEIAEDEYRMRLATIRDVHGRP